MSKWSSEVNATIVGTLLLAALTACGFLLYNYYEYPDESFAGFYFGKVSNQLLIEIPLYIAVITLLLGLILGCLLTRWFWPRRMNPPSAEPRSAGGVPVPAIRPTGIGARIIVPGDGTRHPESTITVRGTHERDPEVGEELVVLTSRQGVYYPQSRLTSTGPRSWECLCEEKNTGETKIHVGVGGPRYRDRARQYFDVGKANKGWHGFKLGVPPDDVRFDHTISIYIDAQAE
jgi:hypothetical protein